VAVAVSAQSQWSRLSRLGLGYISRLGHGVSMIILIVDRRQLEELARIDCPRRRRAILRILALRRSVLVVEGPAHKCRPSSSPATAEGDFVDGAA